MLKSSDNIEPKNQIGFGSFVRFIFNFIIGLFLTLFISWSVSIFIEAIGITFIWEDKGASRSYNMLLQEAKYVGDASPFKSLGFDKSVANRADEVFTYLNDKTKLIDFFGALGEYGQAFKNVTLIFILRNIIIVSCSFVFLLFTIWSISEGCSGLIEMDTLIKDNVVNYWSPYESKTSIQELPKRV